MKNGIVLVVQNILHALLISFSLLLFLIFIVIIIFTRIRIESNKNIDNVYLQNFSE